MLTAIGCTFIGFALGFLAGRMDRSDHRNQPLSASDIRKMLRPDADAEHAAGLAEMPGSWSMPGGAR